MSNLTNKPISQIAIIAQLKKFTGFQNLATSKIKNFFKFYYLENLKFNYQDLIIKILIIKIKND